MKNEKLGNPNPKQVLYNDWVMFPRRLLPGFPNAVLGTRAVACDLSYGRAKGDWRQVYSGINTHTGVWGFLTSAVLLGFHRKDAYFLCVLQLSVILLQTFLLGRDSRPGPPANGVLVLTESTQSITGDNLPGA